jgi:hypothetical protein
VRVDTGLSASPVIGRQQCLFINSPP